MEGVEGVEGGGGRGREERGGRPVNDVLYRRRWCWKVDTANREVCTRDGKRVAYRGAGGKGSWWGGDGMRGAGILNMGWYV